MLFSTKTAEMQAKIDGLEATLAEVNASLALANADLATAREQITTANADIERIKGEHETALKAKDEEIECKVNIAVIDAMAAIGVPQEKLPAASTGPASNDYDAKIEDLNQQIAATNDPKKKGQLASQILDLMASKDKTAKN